MGYIWVTKNSALTQKCCIIVLSYSHLKPVENLSIGLKQPNQEPRPSNQSLKALGSRFPNQQPQQTGHHESKRLGLFTLRTGRMLPSCRGVTAPNGCGSAAWGIGATPLFRPPRLGPRPYTSSAVNSFGGCFVWVLWLAHQVWSVVAATPLADSTQSDHESPNAPAIARSVYVIAHTTALPARLGPRFWVVTNNICR